MLEAILFCLLGKYGVLDGKMVREEKEILMCDERSTVNGDEVWWADHMLFESLINIVPVEFAIKLLINKLLANPLLAEFFFFLSFFGT